jgi:hypothetical protein
MRRKRIHRSNEETEFSLEEILSVLRYSVLIRSSAVSVPGHVMKRSLRSWLWRVPIRQEVDEELSVPHRDAHARTGRARDGSSRARELVLSRIGDLGQLKRTVKTSAESEIETCD